MEYIESVTRNLKDMFNKDSYYIEDLVCPYKQASSLPKGYVAVHMLIYGTKTEYKFLKIGKADYKNNA